MTHIINPKVTSRQIDIITGTILGGSSIVKPKKGKNCYLSMRGKYEKWLYYKASELDSLASFGPIIIEKTNRWHSLCYPVFNEFYEDFYKDNKRFLNMETLSLLKPLSWAIWFGDSGKLIKNKIILNTHIWKEDTELINKYFNEIGFKSSIFKEKNSFRISFNENDSIKYLKIITSHLPHFFINTIL